MAKPITTIRRLELTEEEQRQRDLEELQTILIEHKDVLKDFLHMLKKIEERSGLEMVTGLFDRGDEVLDVLVKATDKPEVAKIIKNSLLMLGVLGKISIEDMSPFVEKLNGGLSQAARAGSEKPEATYGAMLRMLTSSETKEAMMFLLSFLQGMGKGKPNPPAAAPEKPKEAGSKKTWLLAAGLSLAGAALLSTQFSKKDGYDDDEYESDYEVMHHQ